MPVLNFTTYIITSTTGLTKPGEVGEILALYRLKSLSLAYKAKLKSPCFNNNNNKTNAKHECNVKYEGY